MSLVYVSADAHNRRHVYLPFMCLAPTLFSIWIFPSQQEQ